MNPKSSKKLAAMTEGGHLLAKIRDQLAQKAKPGVKLIEIDQLAEKLIIEDGGQPAFKLVKGYDWSTCINVNSGVVHGIPNDYIIKDGDTVAIDVGMFFKGYNTDTSVTVPIGKISVEKKDFLSLGKQSLDLAIAEATPGNRVWHISRAMQEMVENAGYSVVRHLTGHGVGKNLHEKPHIPCYAEGKPESTSELKEGQTLAIEVIYTMGDPELVTEADGWTISTQDGKMAGLFEETVAVTKAGPVVLTK